MNTALAPTHMAPWDLQETNERRFSRKHISTYIDTAIRENPDSEAKVHEGVARLHEWRAYWAAPWTDQCTTEKYWSIKNTRLSQLDQLDIEQLVRTIYTQIAYCQAEELYVSVTAQLAMALGFSDRRDSIITVAEIVAVLSQTDAFDLRKASEEASVMVISLLVLPTNLLDAIARSVYMPPMVCTPPDVESNFESPHLTFNDCLILGKGNSHAGDICLDVINIQNKVVFRLDTDFLSTVEELPTYELDTLEKYKAWHAFKCQSYELYDLMAHQGNEFHLLNKYDKRGRLYCQGYHITTQGSPMKKAMLELHKQELIQGVPTHD